MEHAPGFLALVTDAKTKPSTTSAQGQAFHLIDVREDREWAAGRIPGAVHMGRGVIERDIEARISYLDAKIVLYCGGGFRSALSADHLQKMGYSNVVSMAGGYRGWVEAGHSIER